MKILIILMRLPLSEAITKIAPVTRYSNEIVIMEFCRPRYFINIKGAAIEPKTEPTVLKKYKLATSHPIVASRALIEPR
ncbi:MAG TPA: hypothetical protein PKL57_20075, partial [Candidatus Wallbacteria bacterium]|nr:hypothetical protein [Candidatus Wallbacteria bacterium]